MHLIQLGLVPRLCVVFAACTTSSSHGDRIPLMQGKVFVCQADERLIHPAPKSAVDSYATALNDYHSLQLPLYRRIETPSGLVFLSVVLAEPNANPTASILAEDRDAILDHAVDASGSYLLLQKNDRWYIVTFPAILTDPRIALSYASADSTSAHTWHATREALRRIEND